MKVKSTCAFLRNCFERLFQPDRLSTQRSFTQKVPVVELDKSMNTLVGKLGVRYISSETKGFVFFSILIPLKKKIRLKI